ncbi:hypothetical protein Tco_0701072 [Tanacetum coccineum]
MCVRAQNKHSEERTANKEVPLSSEEQALHDELVRLMHQESIAKVHNDAQRSAFEEEKRRIALEKGKESANSTLTQGTAETQGAANIPQSPNDYTPTGESQTSGGDEGLLDLYALNREVRRLKKQTISHAKQIHKLKAKLKKLSKGVKPLVKHHILWVKSQKLKFDGKSEEGYLLGYSTSSKGFRVYNRVTRKVQDCLHVDFLETQENQKGKGPDWMFDLELLTPSMNYIPVRKENYGDSGGKVSTHADVEVLDDQQFIVMIQVAYL